MFLRCPKAAVFKLCVRNLLPKPRFRGNSWAGFVDRECKSEGGKAVFRLFRLLLLLRMNDRIDVEVKTK